MFLFIIFSYSSQAQNIVGSNKVKDIYQKVSKAVVYIDSVQYIRQKVYTFSDPFFDRFFGDMFDDNPDFFSSPHYNNVIPRKGQGSGFIFSKDGYIFTNEHVIDKADKITVTLSDGSKYDAKVVGKDENYDVAILKIDADKALPVMKLGESNNLEVGEWVLAIGNPFGLQQTLTVGIISALGRNLPIGRNKVYSDLIQTDASINPGNSGGPLINMNGEVIGINSAIIPYGQGLGFAIPINTAKHVFKEIKEYGKVRYPQLGIYLQELTDDLKDYFHVNSGVIVSDVIKGQAADKAGIKRGDVIIKYNGKNVSDSKDLIGFVKSGEIGQKVFITIVRNGKELVKAVTLTAKKEKKPSFKEKIKKYFGGAWNKTDSIHKIREMLGITVRKLDKNDKQKLGISEGGVVVSNIDRNGLIARYGLLSRGDVILQVNGEKISSPDELYDLLKDANTKKGIVLVVYSGGFTKYVSLKIN